MVKIIHEHLLIFYQLTMQFFNFKATKINCKNDDNLSSHKVYLNVRKHTKKQNT